jgi:hypothetical protein
MGGSWRYFDLISGVRWLIGGFISGHVIERINARNWSNNVFLASVLFVLPNRIGKSHKTLRFLLYKKIFSKRDETDLRFSRRWLSRMASSGMLRLVALVRTDVSEELSASFIRVTGIGELGTTLAVTSNRRTLRRNTKYLKNGFFWDVTPCGSCKNQRFG